MRVLGLALAGALLALGAGGGSPDAVLAPLTSALDDAEVHVAALAQRAQTASPTTLAMATDDEQGAISAIVQADAALDRMMHGVPAALPQKTDVAVLAELDRAHDAIGSYVQARLHANRNLMRAAASDAADALARADALVGGVARPR